LDYFLHLVTPQNLSYRQRGIVVLSRLGLFKGQFYVPVLAVIFVAFVLTSTSELRSFILVDWSFDATDIKRTYTLASSIQIIVKEVFASLFQLGRYYNDYNDICKNLTTLLVYAVVLGVSRQVSKQLKVVSPNLAVELSGYQNML
jgi:hypothetical protein